MPSSLFLFGPQVLCMQAALLLALAWPLAWPLAWLLRWQAWWQRALLVGMAWACCSVGGFVLFALNGADVFLIPYLLAKAAIPAALAALVAWLALARLVKNID
jgi:hypothetical protein